MLIREQLCHRPCGQGQLQQSDPSLRSTPCDLQEQWWNSFVRSCPEATGHPPPNLEGLPQKVRCFVPFWFLRGMGLPTLHHWGYNWGWYNHLAGVWADPHHDRAIHHLSSVLPGLVPSCRDWGCRKLTSCWDLLYPFLVINSLHPPGSFCSPHPNRWQSGKSYLGAMAVVTIKGSKPDLIYTQS